MFNATPYGTTPHHTTSHVTVRLKEAEKVMIVMVMLLVQEE